MHSFANKKYRPVKRAKTHYNRSHRKYPKRAYRVHRRTYKKTYKKAYRHHYNTHVKKYAKSKIFKKYANR